MPRYYSENGEDALLDRLFADQREGFFVEVGCIDGLRHSNTLAFEQRGWRGMCIEPHAAYTALLRANRPGSIVCDCAVGATDADAVPFYANRWGSLSSLDPSRAAEFKQRFGERFAGFEQQTVRQERLDSLFQRHGVASVDILSLDVEGTEADVLRGIDFERVRPRVIVVESERSQFRRRIEAILFPAGYVRSVRFAQNIFYLADPRLERRAWGQRFTAQLHHLRHPLDAGPDVTIEDVTIDTRRVTAFRRMLGSHLHAPARWLPRLLGRRSSRP